MVDPLMLRSERSLGNTAQVNRVSPPLSAFII